MQSAKLKCIVFYLFIMLQTIAQTPQLVLQKGHLNAIKEITFSNNDKKIITIGADGSAKLWDPYSGKLLSDYKEKFLSPVTFYNKKNRFKVTREQWIADNFCDPVSGDLLLPSDSEYGAPKISPGGFYGSVDNDKKEIIIQQLNSSTIYKTIKRNNDSLFERADVKFISDSTIFIQTSFFNPKTFVRTTSISVYDFKRDVLVATFHPNVNVNSDYIWVMGNTGKYFLIYDGAALEKGNLQLWDIAQQKMLWQKSLYNRDREGNWKYENGYTNSNIAFNEDDSKILIVCDWKHINKNDYSFDSPYKTYEVSIMDTSQIINYGNDYDRFNTIIPLIDPIYSPGYNYIARVNINKGFTDPVTKVHHEESSFVEVWNRSHKVVSICSVKDEPTAMSFSHDEKYLVTGYENGNYIVWDISDSIATEVTSTKNIIDPIVGVHDDPFHKRSMYITNHIYSVFNDGELNKLSFLNIGNQLIKDIHFLYKDQYSVLDVGYGKQSYMDLSHLRTSNLLLINNDSLSVIKRMPYNCDYHHEGVINLIPDSNIENGSNPVDTVFQFHEHLVESAGLISDGSHGKSSVFYGDDKVIKTLQYQDLQSFSMYSKPLLNNNGGYKNTIYAFDGPPEDKNVRFTYGVLKTKTGSDTALLFANTEQSSPLYNKDLDGYVYRYDNLHFIRKNDLSVSTFSNVRKLAWEVVSNNGKYILGTKYENGYETLDNYLYCVDLKNNLKFKTPKIFKGIEMEEAGETVFSPDEKKLAIARDNFIRIINAQNGVPLFNLTDHTDAVMGVEFTTDSKYLYSWSLDGTSKKWEVGTGKLIYTFIIFTDNDYAIILPEGYYYISSRTDAKYLNFNLHNRLYNFSQFDLQYNRPDKVMQAIGSKDIAMITAYHKAWLDRITKSGFTEEKLSTNELHVPEVIFQSDTISSITKEKELNLNISFSDSLYKISRYNIFINDVPLNGMNGKVFVQPANSLHVSQLVLLSEGENKIEVSCTNEKGIESRKETFYINYKPEQLRIHKTYFIGIGINQYSQHSSFKDLNYCVKDIRDLAAAFREKFKDDIVIDTLIDSMVTKENILALRQKLLQTNVDDKVIVSFSGHGMVDPNDQNEFYFVTGKTDVSNPSQYGISYAQLEDLLDSIPARKKLMLLDACHSGESDENELSNTVQNIPGTKRGADELNMTNESSVQIISVANDAGKGKPGTTNIFKLMKEAFVDIRRNNGAYVISASQSNETAEENKEIKNGVFTHCLLEQIMQKHSINVNDLSININKCVSESTMGTQNTANRQELAEFNWQLW